MSATLVWFNKNHDMLTNSDKNSKCKHSWNSVPWESLFHVGRWLDGQPWQGSQSFLPIASYLHLTTRVLFFQNHIIFKSRQVHFLSTPHHPPCHIRVMPQLFLYVPKHVVCFMDRLHTISHLDTAACSIPHISSTYLLAESSASVSMCSVSGLLQV